MKSLRDLLTSTSIIGSFHTTDMLDSIIDVNQRIWLNWHQILFNSIHLTFIYIVLFTRC